MMIGNSSEDLIRHAQHASCFIIGLFLKRHKQSRLCKPTFNFLNLNEIFLSTSKFVSAANILP